MENINENIKAETTKKRIRLFPMFEDDKVYDCVLTYCVKKKMSPYDFIIESIKQYIAKDMRNENIILNTNLNTNEIHNIILKVTKKRTGRTMMQAVEACVAEYIIEVSKEYLPKVK